MEKIIAEYKEDIPLEMELSNSGSTCQTLVSRPRRCVGRKVLYNHLPAGTGGLRDLHISDLITVCFKVNAQSKEDQSPKPRSPRAWTDTPQLLISWCFLASQWARVCPRQLRQIGWLRPFH